VPALPSASQIWARVRQIGQAEGIRVPLAGNPPFDESGTPAQYRALLGAWGPGVWQGNPGGDRTILVVEGVDSDRNVHGVIGRSDREWYAFSVALSGNQFTVESSHLDRPGYFNVLIVDAHWQLELRSDGKIYGSRNEGASSIVLPRLQ
jgi:hypothetical protein